MGRRVGEIIAESLGAEPARVHACAAIHGTADPDLVAEQVLAVLRAVVGTAAADRAVGLFHGVSVGSVTGVRIADGSGLVVKGYQPRWTREFLAGVVVTQRRLHDAGLACARPVGGPLSYGRGLATVETLVADPGQPAHFGDAERRASAEGLGAVIDNSGSDDRLGRHPQRLHDGGLYPTPHSPIFDFDATLAGAEWIDELATAARARRAPGPLVTAHTDWSARNVRLSSSGVQAIYDMDSLARVSLPTAIGQAAATWRATGEPDDNEAPGIDEIHAWIDCYPAQINSADRAAAAAAALWVLAYTARCEHAIDPHERTHHRARSRLRADGEAFRQALRSR